MLEISPRESSRKDNGKGSTGGFVRCLMRAVNHWQRHLKSI